MSTTELPYPRRLLPTLRINNFALLWSVLWAISCWLLFIVTESSFFWTFISFLSAVITTAVNLRVRKKLIEHRQWARDENFRSWLLHRDIPPLNPSENWEEIELGIEALLARGIEPTVERAKDKLRKAKTGLCDHENAMKAVSMDDDIIYWRCEICSATVRHGQLPPPPQPIPEDAQADVLRAIMRKFFEAGDTISDFAEGKPICERCGAMHYPRDRCAGDPYGPPTCEKCGGMHHPHLGCANPFKRRR